jgi:Cd2+/Zn2+-exporting ATPase
MSNQATQTFHITGMDCADCARSIERNVSKLDGVQLCVLNFASAKLKVEGTVERDAVISRVKALGYGVRENEARDSTTNLASQDRLGRYSERLLKTGALGFLGFLLSRINTALAVLGAILILPSLVLHELLPFLGVGGVWLDATALAAMIVTGAPIAQSAWRALRVNREININLLMTIAAIGAVVIGAYTEAGLVMVLFAIGEALEGYTTERARDSIRSLMKVSPNEVTLLRACIDCAEHLGKDGYTGGACPICGLEETKTFVDELKVGDVIVTKPGERIGMDGRVIRGASSVNQAPITGEGAPVLKVTGSEVFAGSINGEGALEIEVTRLAKDNTISRIIKMVEEAQEHKAPAERFVDQFAKYYTPLVVFVAILVAVVPPLFFNAPFWKTPTDQGWLYRALVLLVVACPCALVISTPVAIISAISNAARNGVLFKGGASLEALGKIKAFAFDKTGTLTEGKPSVVEIRSVACLNRDASHIGPRSVFHDPQEKSCAACSDLLALANAVEKRSEHPIAKAIVAAAESHQLGSRYPAAENMKAIVGKGVAGIVNGKAIVIGSHSYFDQNISHNEIECDDIREAASRGQTPMLVGSEGKYLGYITVADVVRESSKAALAQLKHVGIDATIMLTGDNEQTARVIASMVGVTDIRSDLLPEHKVDAIKSMLQKHGSVAMVGDGVNDAPALATATLGIAMGAGTAQAMETADITLMNNDLSRLPFAVRLARAAMNTIRANIVFAIGIKIVFLVLVLLGMGTMWLAVFADVGASLLVTLNGIRLLKWRSAM